MLSLRRQLQSAICRWLLNQPLDEGQSWHDCHSIKTDSSGTMNPSIGELIGQYLDPAGTAAADCRERQEPRRALSLTPDTAPRFPKRLKMAHPVATPAELERPTHRWQWPANALPVEIFEIIASYLPRGEIKTLRLVCREFEHKSSALYFRNVVVPFRSELYGNLDRDEDGRIQQHPVSLLSNAGNRIFEAFGPHIWRFALSLEIDEDALAYPPLKLAQQAVPSFWGIYRWPHRSYNRYADLESIEQKADETQGMKDVLRCLTAIRNLGLCCDAGLGFLIQPDSVACSRVVKQPVFASHDWRGDSRAYAATHSEETTVTVADFNGKRRPRRKTSTDSLDYKQSALERMMADAGYDGEQIQEAIELLLETEGQAVDEITFEGRPNPAESFTELTDNTEVPNVSHITNRRRGRPEPRAQARAAPPALVPNNLTKAQKEVILELEWAHRAMIQSFVIATIDNANAGCFESLTTLTIAKIPSSHIFLLYNNDFWSSLTNLHTVHLGVIADWRKVTKNIFGLLEDDHVSPVKAVSKVYTLLNEYIGKRPNIENLHFEWICGGEFAPSFAQRNRYVLPMPVLDPSVMVCPIGRASEDLLDEQGLLELPFVKQLSLKNCWASPHVLWQTIRQMSLASLEKLQFESVSLSAPYTTQPQLPLAQGHLGGAGENVHVGPFQQPQPPVLIPAATGHWAGHQQPQGWPLPPTAVPYTPVGDPASSATLETLPEWHSWSGFLEHFSPSLNVRHIRASRQYDWDDPADGTSWGLELLKTGRLIPNPHFLLGEERQSKIKSISLKSCGRVAIDDPHIATRSLARHAAIYSSTSDTQNGLQNSMQQDWNPMLGRVIPHAEPQELRTLLDVFGLVHGWHGVYSDKLIAAAKADGIAVPGCGRFSGVLDEMGSKTDFGMEPSSSAEARKAGGLNPDAGACSSYTNAVPNTAAGGASINHTSQPHWVPPQSASLDDDDDDDDDEENDNGDDEAALW